MLRLMICVAALACGTAFAAPPADNAQSAPASPLGSSAAFVVKPATISAAPDQLFPPVPSLASLPPPAGGEDDDAPAPTSNRHAKKSRRAPVRTVPVQVHMVVTDESRALLTAVEKKLDEALQAGPRDRRPTADGVSVATTH
jgi:hypothetical protein